MKTKFHNERFNHCCSLHWTTVSGEPLRHVLSLGMQEALNGDETPYDASYLHFHLKIFALEYKLLFFSIIAASPALALQPCCKLWYLIFQFCF